MNPLIKTKLRPPVLRPNLLPRPRLLARLRAGLQGPLTLISAPAGFGKTTCALAGVAAAAVHCAWLSLDDGDNDEYRFLAYVTAALQVVDPQVGQTAADLLAGPQIAPPPVALAALINDLADAGDDLILALDDYHLIHSPAVHSAVAALIEQGPPNLHLLITTRVDPPLPLARLRVRGQLAELRAADLRFSAAETALFLNEVMGLALDAGLVTLLDERTEGWAAGLQLAALRLASGGPESVQDAAAFVRHFSGAQSHILDYLLEEVLERQEPAVQRFLLLTSPLPRLCGPLCDAVLRAVGETAAGDTSPPSAALLAALERANAFLLPLDDQRNWYRYHHLFADLLRIRLRQWRPALEPRLYAAAAAWLEDQGLTGEAIEAALAAGDHLRAARLVEQNAAGLLARGELASLLGWIGTLPPDVRGQRPSLCLQQAYALAFAGQLAEASAALDLAERSPLAEAQAGAVKAVRAMVAVMSGGESGAEAGAVALAELALAQLPDDALWDRATAYWALGFARRSLGDLEAARRCFAEQVHLARALGNVWTLVTGLTDLALVYRTQGELVTAHGLLDEALQAAASQGARGLGYIARAETALADVSCAQGDLDAAEQLLASAFAHVGRWPNPNHIVYAHLVQARVQRLRGDAAAAEASLGQAQAVCQAASVTSGLRRQLEAALTSPAQGRAGQTGAPVTSSPTGAAPTAPKGAGASLVEPLSAREREVLTLLAQGLSNQEIAAKLIISAGTVKAHTAAIYRKFDVGNRTEAAARARQLGLLD